MKDGWGLLEVNQVKSGSSPIHQFYFPQNESSKMLLLCIHLFFCGWFLCSYFLDLHILLYSRTFHSMCFPNVFHNSMPANYFSKHNAGTVSLQRICKGERKRSCPSWPWYASLAFIKLSLYTYLPFILLELYSANGYYIFMLVTHFLRALFGY